MIEYKDYYLFRDYYGSGEYTVEHDGDPYVFDTEEEAKAFIDEVTE